MAFSNLPQLGLQASSQLLFIPVAEKLYQHMYDLGLTCLQDLVPAPSDSNEKEMLEEGELQRKFPLDGFQLTNPTKHWPRTQIK